MKNHIHTILLLVGLGLMTYAGFLINDIVGYGLAGIFLVSLGIYIDNHS